MGALQGIDWERVGGLEARVVWLDGWKRADRERAESEGIDHVLLVKRAKSKRTKPDSARYVDSDGNKARIDFKGVASEVELRLLRRGERAGDWIEVGSWERGRVRDEAPSTLLVVDGRIDGVMDLDHHLAGLLSDGVRRGVDFLAAEALWSARAHIREQSGRLGPEQAFELWTLAVEASGGGVAYPRASLCAAAVQAWQRLERELAELTPLDAQEGCEWCRAEVQPEPCACPQGAALQALIEATRELTRPIDPGPGDEPRDLTEGLRGDRPTLALAAAGRLRSALEGYSERALERALDVRVETTNVRGPGPFVLLAGDGQDVLISRLDPDSYEAVRTLLERATDEELDRWRIRIRTPFAAIIERENPRSLFGCELSEVVKGRKLDESALESLLDSVRWGEFR